MSREEEIKNLANRLTYLWLKHPEQRLGQLLENYVFTRGQRGDKTSLVLFFQKDDETLVKLFSEKSKKEDEEKQARVKGACKVLNGER